MYSDQRNRCETIGNTTQLNRTCYNNGGGVQGTELVWHLTVPLMESSMKKITITERTLPVDVAGCEGSKRKY
jgi:hypothetical protein